jgi:PKD repeat protein
VVPRRCLLLLLLAGSLCAPTSASAAVTNLIPWSANEDAPSDSFTSDDGIMAYYTSTIVGAQGICIVAATVSDPGDNSLACDANLVKFGGSTPVIGIGSNWVPLAPPPLTPGHYRLLADGGGNGTEPDKLSTDFWVSECTSCDPAPALGVFQRWKDSAAAPADGLQQACALYATMNVASTGFSTGRALVEGAGSTVPNVFVVAAGGGLAFGLLLDTAPQSALLEKHLAMLRAVTCRASDMFKAIVADPPRDDWTTVSTPSMNSTLSPVADPELGQLQFTLDAMRAHGEAELPAAERYQGADIADNQPGMNTQAAAIADNGSALAADMRAAAIQLDALADRFAAVGANQPLTQAAYDAAVAFRDRVKTSGLTQAERDALTAAGISSAGAFSVAASFASQVLPADAVGSSLVSTTRRLATRLREQAVEQDAVAQAFASSLTRPTASTLAAVITEDSGSAQLAPLAMRLSGEASVGGGKAIVSYHWAFSDGATDEGIETTHVFPASGTHTATLTVKDANGATDTAQVSATAVARSELDLPMCREDGALHPNCDGFQALAPGGAFTVAGTGPQTVEVTHLAHLGAWTNALVWFEVDDPQGAIGGALPGSDAWYPAALSRMRMLFGPEGTSTDPTTTPLTASLTIGGGRHIAFALLTHAPTLGQLIDVNPFNRIGSYYVTDHVFTAANPYRIVQALPYVRSGDGMVQIGFEDQPGVAENFTDEVYDIKGVRADPIGDLAATITADDPDVLTEDEDGYQITIRNSGSGAVVLDSISATLPAGFAYVPGSTRGASDANPSIGGRTLRWDKRVVVPARGKAGLHLRVTAGPTPGEFLASATADARGIPLTPSGEAAPIKVAARPAVTPQATPSPPPSATPTPQPPAPSPTPTPITAASVIKLPANKACVSRRRFRIRLVAPKTGRLISATVTINGKSQPVIKGKRLRAQIDLRGLPKGRFTVRIVAKTDTGARLVATRRYRTCVGRR